MLIFYMFDCSDLHLQLFIASHAFIEIFLIIEMLNNSPKLIWKIGSWDPCLWESIPSDDVSEESKSAPVLLRLQTGSLDRNWLGQSSLSESNSKIFKRNTFSIINIFVFNKYFFLELNGSISVLTVYPFLKLLIKLML